MQPVLGRDRELREVPCRQRSHEQRRPADVVDRVLPGDLVVEQASGLVGRHRLVGDKEHRADFVWEGNVRRDQAALAVHDNGTAAQHRRRHVVGMSLDLHGEFQKSLRAQLAGMRRQEESDAKRSGAVATLNEMAGLFEDEELRSMFLDDATKTLE